MILNNKGFTLFTALISLILVSISLALVFNMIATEETYLDLIQDQASMSDLITMGDLAKADAFNSFLISLRSKWEEYKSDENSKFTITRKQVDMNWDDFVNNFVKVDFFEKNFAGYFAQSLLYNLEYKQNPPGYAITIKKDVGSMVDNVYQDNNSFNSIIEQIFIDGGQKVDIVDCDQEDDSCNGSFYLTLDTTQLSDSNYELLPIITVLRYKTNQVIQRPILNRQVYKIYMPWRGFQAFRVARRMALGDAEREEIPAISENYNGLFDPALHNNLEQARLGFCDPGTCSPRPGFFTTPETKGFNGQCNMVASVNLAGASTPSYLDVGPIEPGSYDPKDSATMASAFDVLYRDVFEANLPDESSYGYTGLIMKGDISNSDSNVLEIKVDTEGKETKKIVNNGPVTSIDVGNYDSTTFDTLTEISGKAGGLGIFLNDNKSQYVWDEIMTLQRAWHILHVNKQVGADSSPAEVNFKCTELKSIDILLKFEETDPRYYVREEYIAPNGQSRPVQINVILQDRYTEFYFPDATDFWTGLSIDGKYLSEVPGNLSEDFETQWTCSTTTDGSGSRCGIRLP